MKDKEAAQPNLTALFPAPWRIKRVEGGFRIEDGGGRGLAYVYSRTDPALWGTFLTPAEAETMAKAIGRLSRGNGSGE